MPTRRALAPIPGMARPPRLDPGDVHRAAEVALVLRRGAASAPGWRPCWPLCRRSPSSNAGDGGYAGRDEITFRQHLHLRRLPPAIASPPARTHHRQGDPLTSPDVGSSHPRSFAISERSIDRPGPSRDRNFKPLVLGQNQSDADIGFADRGSSLDVVACEGETSAANPSPTLSSSNSGLMSDPLSPVRCLPSA